MESSATPKFGYTELPPCTPLIEQTPEVETYLVVEELIPEKRTDPTRVRADTHTHTHMRARARARTRAERIPERIGPPPPSLLEWLKTLPYAEQTEYGKKLSLAERKYNEFVRNWERAAKGDEEWYPEVVSR